MAAETVSQISYNPTNKLSASTISTSLVALAHAIVAKYWPEYADPTIWAAVYPLVGFVVGYFVKDKPNVEVAANV